MAGPGPIRAFLQLRWLGMDRIGPYGLILLLGSLLSVVHRWFLAMGPDGSDFQAFWSAARLVVLGTPDKVYDLAATGAVQAGAGRAEVYAFVNPPPLLFPIAPLGLLPYPLAWAVWIAATWAAWLAVTRLLAPRLTAPIAAFPGALVAAWHAQTGFLTSTLQAGAAVLLHRRPFLAGLCVGALVIKPHLAVLFPIAFIAGGHWRAFAGAAVGAIGLVALSGLVFGLDTVLAYPESWKVSQYLMETGSREFFLRQVTVYAALRPLGGAALAGAAQGGVTLLMAWTVWRTWRKPWPLDGQIAVLMAATPLATPYLFSYDLPFLIVPVLWLARREQDRPRGGWERALIMALYFAPMVTRAIALPLGANLMPWVMLATVALLVRRMRGEAGGMVNADTAR